MADKKQIKEILKAHATIENGKWVFKAVDLADACMEIEQACKIPDDLIDSVGVQLRIIKSLVGGTRIVNLDESIAYYESIAKKYNQPLQ